MPEHPRRKSPTRRVHLFDFNHRNGAVHKVVVSRSVVVAWTSVVCWGSLLWAFQVLHQQDWDPAPVTGRSGYIEGVTPPKPQRQTVWSDLYTYSTEETTRVLEKGETQPRVWPRNYESIPRASGPQELLSNERATKEVELRHVSGGNKYCVPKSNWHKFSFPTCNSMHELDLTSAVVPPLQTSFVNQYNVEKEFDDDKGEIYMEFMFSGASRTAWEVHSICIDGKDCVAPGLNATDQKKTGPKLVLKTLNWNMKYDEVTYDHQRVDALAAERLTSSPHVINAYSFCGGSVINEFADGGSFGRMVRRLNGTVIPSEQLIVYARDAALGLADIHEIDGRGNVTTLTHHDYAAKNFLTVNGKLKISDFNDGQLLRWDTRFNRRCHGFFWDGKCGSTRERTHRRSPEECLGDRYRRSTNEKVEVYHLGSFLFYLLTSGGWPYQYEISSKGIPHKPTSPKVKEMIVTGVLPRLPAEVANSNNAATKVLIQAMKWAYTHSPRKRPSARAVGEFLDKKIKDLDLEEGV